MTKFRQPKYLFFLEQYDEGNETIENYITGSNYEGDLREVTQTDISKIKSMFELV